MCFNPGDEVVCVNDNDPPQTGEGPPVVKGQHYTVVKAELRGRIIGRYGPILIAEPTWYVHLAEVPSPKGVGFFAFRFRLAEKKTKETDISIFKEIADGSRLIPLREDEKIPQTPEKVE